MFKHILWAGVALIRGTLAVILFGTAEQAKAAVDFMGGVGGFALVIAFGYAVLRLEDA